MSEKENGEAVTDCGKIQERLSEYLERTTSSKETAAIQEHLRSCRRCSEYLADLERTVEHVKSLEEVEPPAWLTQKVMARVKAEAEQNKGIFRKLFYPLRVKLPIEAAAGVLITIATIYIFKTVQPETKFVQAPSEETRQIILHEKGKETEKQPGLEAGGRKEAVSESEKKSVAGRDRAFVPDRSRAAISKDEKVSSGVRKPEVIGRAELSRDAAQIEDQKEKDLMQFSASPGSPAPVAKTRAGKIGEKAGLTIYVPDLSSARNRIEDIIREIGGSITRSESFEIKQVITAEIEWGKMNELKEKLKLLGEVKGEAKPTSRMRGSIRVEIAIEETP
ncbi:MAG: DUF2275 domain-containing protein [Nitrospirota bacterium]